MTRTRPSLTFLSGLDPGAAPSVVRPITFAWCDFADPYGNPIGPFQDLGKHPWRDAS